MYEPDIDLTDTGREVIALARTEAQRLQHEYVGTEHRALALTRTAVLQDLAVEVERVRDMIEGIVHRGAKPASPDVALPYTSRTKHVLDLARESASGAAGPEHLLLGLLREARGVGGQVLLHLGVSEAATLDAIARVNQERGPRADESS